MALGTGGPHGGGAKGGASGPSVRAGQRPASQISGRAHSGLAQSRQMQVVHPRVPKAGKVPSQAPGETLHQLGDLGQHRVDTAEIGQRHPCRSGAKRLGAALDQGCLLLWALDGKRIADGRRMRRAPASRSPASRARLEAGLDLPDRRAGSESWRPDKLCVRVCGVFGAGRAPSSAARQGCHA